MDQVNKALGILIIGMVTVFVILTLVVLIGKAAILATNKFAPEAAIKKTNKTGATTSNNTLAAIAAAVNIITKGKGKITNIKKV